MERDDSKVEAAYLKIKELITHFHFVADQELRIAPGEHLQVDELSDRVRVSATPVRQALARLHAEALVDSIPNRGFFSKIPNVVELRDLYDFALMVLDCCIKNHRNELSTRDGTRPTIVGVAPGAGPIRDWPVQFQAAVIEHIFHRIARCSNNTEALRMIRNFNDRSRYIRCLYFEENLTAAGPGETMANLIDALQAADIERACTHLRQQLTREVERLPDLVRRGQAGEQALRPLPVRRVMASPSSRP